MVPGRCPLGSGQCTTIQWTNTNFLSQPGNTNFAQAPNIGQNQFSQQLQVSNFGFNIPSDMAIQGFAINIYRRADVASKF